MAHPADGEAWHALDCFNPEFARDSQLFDDLVYQLMVSLFSVPAKNK